MNDLIEKIGNSIIHHGKQSNRIYLMSLSKIDAPNIIQKLEPLAKQRGYTKIIAKIPNEYSPLFLDKGYEKEAFVPMFFKGEKDCYFMSKYFDELRSKDTFEEKSSDIVEMAQKIARENFASNIHLELSDEFLCRQAKESDISLMKNLYRKVFKSYPFPIYEEKYILKTMSDNVIYYGIWHKDKLIGLSSIEMDPKNNNAEMTDFAVLDQYRGEGLSLYLLNEMEKRLKDLNIKTTYTIARSKSAGMNITFAKKGYIYSGRLINNTNISGQIESMNVWYKNIFT